MSKSGFFFEHDEEHLFGLEHEPKSASADIGFVICHPFGEEKQFSYPILVRFARVLAANGYPVLRFDYQGYGESSGSQAQTSLENQIRETQTTVAVARDRFEVRHIALLGLRMGSTVAALAAEREAEISGLILLSPIIGGQSYCDELLRRKLFAEMLAGGPRRSQEQILLELQETGYLKIEGNRFTETLRQGLASVDLSRRDASHDEPVFLGEVRQQGGRTARPSLEDLASSYSSAGAPVELVTTDERPYWDKTSMYESFFPETLFQKTLLWIQKNWPISNST